MDQGPELMDNPADPLRPLFPLLRIKIHSFIPSQGGRERTQRPSVQKEEQKLFIKSCSVTLDKAVTLSETVFSPIKWGWDRTDFS